MLQLLTSWYVQQPPACVSWFTSKRMQTNFLSGPAVTYAASVILFSHYFWHFGVLALFCTIITPPLNCGKERLGGWKALLKNHRQNRVVMGAAAQPGPLLRCWVPCLDSTKEKSKNSFGTRTYSHGGALCILKISDTRPDMGRNHPPGLSL